MNNLMFVAVGNLLAEAATGAAARSTAGRRHRDAPQPAALLTFPLFHVAGIVNLYLPMATGSKLVLHVPLGHGDGGGLMSRRG